MLVHIPIALGLTALSLVSDMLFYPHVLYVRAFILVFAAIFLAVFSVHVVSAQENDDEADADPVVRTGPLSLDAGQLTAIGNSLDSAGGVSGQSSLTITLNLFDDATYTGIIEHVETTDSGYAAWGSVEGVPLGTVTLVVNGDVIAGTVRSPLGVYDIGMVSDGSYIVSEIDESKLPRPAEPPGADDEDEGPSGASGSSTSTATTTDDGSVVDVMVVHTQKARHRAGGDAAFRTRMDLWEAETNQALTNSGAIPRIDIVHLHETSYPSGSDTYDTRSRLSGTTDGYMDEIHALRDTYAADLVHFVDVEPDYFCGYAYYAVTRSPGQQPTGDASLGFAITYLTCGGLTFAHELGHNFGLYHDRYALSGNNPPSDAAYTYGVGYVNQRAFDTGATSSSRWRTVMAYSRQCWDSLLNCPRVSYFSNPEINHPVSGHPMGIPATATTTGLLGPSDAQLALDNTKSIVAAFRDSSSRCEFSLATSTAQATSSGGSFSVRVTTRDDCPWTAESRVWFLTVTGDTSHTGSATTTFTVSENLGEERAGDINIAGKLFTVNQEGAASPIVTDYDTDDDGLIEVSWLEQLDAIRYDVNGDGVVSEPWNLRQLVVYENAFRYAASGMGCPATGCTGYELAKDLDFSNAASYRSATTSVAWTDTSGSGWRPIDYHSTFDGGSHTISNLFSSEGGLFETLPSSARVRDLGLLDVRIETGRQFVGALTSGTESSTEIVRVFVTGSVRGTQDMAYVGGLVGSNKGSITSSFSEASVIKLGTHTDEAVGGLVALNSGVINASYSTGNVTGAYWVGGLAGVNDEGSINASYSTSNVVSQSKAGGLAGYNNGVIRSSYATGNVEGSTGPRGGLVGVNQQVIPGHVVGGSVDVASYWNTHTSGLSVGVGSGISTNVVGTTTAALKAPIGYSGIYADWNIDIDNADGDDDLTTDTDDVWDFGTSSDYPALKADLDGDGTATSAEFGNQHLVVVGDYDTDDDGLLEITYLEQLDAIRYDLDGDGAVDFPSVGQYLNAYTSAFPAMLDGGGCPVSGCTGYELARDLDFNAADSYASGVVSTSWTDRGGDGWTHITSWDATLDGAGHTVSNLYTKGRGLIRYTSETGSARLVNIGLLDVEVVSGSSAVGGLVGTLSAFGLVRDSYVTGSVSGHSQVGGLVGWNRDRVENSYSTAAVSSENGRGAGGLVGENSGLNIYNGRDRTKAPQIVSSYASGSVSGKWSVGGLVGRNYGSVTGSYATGAVEGGTDVGGLVGWNSGEMTTSYTTGSVSGSGAAVGGLAGWNGDGGRVSHVYATGDVSGSGDNRGGLIGRMNSGGTLSAGYSTGEVSGTGSNLGGLIGSTAGTVSVVSYWDTEASGTTTGLGDGTSAKVVGKTTTELQSPTGYSGIYATWDDDGSDHWDFGSASDYPVLKADIN